MVRMLENIKTLVKRMTGEVPVTVLAKRGLKVGKNLNRQQGSYIDPTHCFLIEIGNNVTLSVRVTILAHDASTKMVTGYTKIGKVIIGDNVFIGANATILPGVTIGNDCVIGANSVVTHDIPANSVVVGNPAKVICSINEFTERNLKNMDNVKLFEEEYRFSRKLTDDRKKEMREAVDKRNAYIR